VSQANEHGFRGETGKQVRYKKKLPSRMRLEPERLLWRSALSYAVSDLWVCDPHVSNGVTHESLVTVPCVREHVIRCILLCVMTRKGRDAMHLTRVSARKCKPGPVVAAL
jgi:hypothetical protein